jgi:anti-anti-sigma regulatory factor
MIRVDYVAKYDAVILELEGDVDAAQARQCLIDLERALPTGTKPLKLLVDISGVDTVDLEAKSELEKGMDLLNAHGVAEIFRTSPNPDLDIGLNVLEGSHFSKRVQIHTFRSRQEAQASLYGGR